MEQPLRLESYYCTNGIATMFGSLIGYAVGHITTGLPRWMYIFLIFGAFSIAAGILALLFLPDQPSTAKFLTERERTSYRWVEPFPCMRDLLTFPPVYLGAVAVERVAENRQGVKNRHFKKYQVWQTLYDPKVSLINIALA